MSSKEFVYGYYFNNDAKGEKILSLETLDTSRKYWLHFDYTKATTKEWFENHSQLNPAVINALLNEETRPRATPLNEGVLISLRGVNLAPDSNPEDMVSIRVWFTPNYIVSTRRRTLLSTKDMADDLEQGIGPKSPAQFTVSLTGRLIERMTDTINDIEDKVAEIEESILTSSTYELRNDVAGLRRQIISLRRYLSPQREAMLQLLSEKITLFSSDEKIQLRETTDHLTRFIEDLDSIKDRAAVTQEEINNRLAEQMNNRMYVLSIVAAIFLPLGFLTGLLGINVGGIPGAENTNAFIIFSGILVVIVALQVLIFKKKKWF
ncbi:zinc transporter ZntB [Thalassotalea profundi]|uniref:Zinc transporter ZntB n=1 Tax=Thalassotalea profundi TaxID=2036687 RepID=A0ABQ3IPG6_9GAMM|nr:zinc transporter ZntB [Thalassotalea profundi]GHE85577.1 zinc transporter ZntB [Thalassotalea profundi]